MTNTRHGKGQLASNVLLPFVVSFFTAVDESSETAEAFFQRVSTVCCLYLAVLIITRKVMNVCAGDAADGDDHQLAVQTQDWSKIQER